MFRKFPFAVVFLTLVFATGCSGPKPINLQGKVVLPNTIKLVETDSVEFRFVPDTDKGKAATATLKVSDMTFSTPEIVPGKYKIAVQITPYAGMPGNDKRARDFQSFNRDHEAEKTKLSTEVSAEPTQSVTVDLVKSTVTKN